jgi:hypothetical protein
MRCSGHGKIRLLVIFLWLLFYVEVSKAQSSFSSNLPIIVINTSGQTIVDEPKITASMGIIDNGEGMRNSISDPFNNYDGKIGIEIRGSSSQMFPKKQYGIELRDDTGEGIKAPLLGMPAEEDWVLFAPYNDKSLMRDALAYKLGRDLGWYAPRTRFCEVILNGQYQGVYVLIEKIKRDKNRVDVNKLNPDEISGDDLTGGYIIKIDKETGSGNGGWTSQFTPPNRNGTQTIFFQYDYPKAADINTQQKAYIKDFMANFEGALSSTTFNDPVNGYTKYIDVNSFIDFFIANEVSKNVDGFRLSTYLYKPKDSDGGKLHMGPIWDFNLGFGNADYCTKGNPEGWVTNFNTLCNGDFWLIPFWWNRLNQDATYRSMMAARWAELREGKFQTSKILSYIDSVYTVLNVEAQQRNFQRWPVLGTYVWPNYYVGSSFQDEVNWLKNWVTNRLNWMDVNMPHVITGMQESISDFTVSAFPNPFEQDVTIEYTLTKPGRFTVELFDVMGKSIISKGESRNDPGTYQLTIPAERFTAGVYYYRAKSGNTSPVTGKILKM